MGSCKQEATPPTTPSYKISLSEVELRDRIWGMVYGSAIGDAMGAPTEMWSREAINLRYGWVDRLDTMDREVSPEGVWVANLPSGGTTDDTRWKELTIEYLISSEGIELNARSFVQHIVTAHDIYEKAYLDIDEQGTLAKTEAYLKPTWLQEWQKVGEPYLNKDFIGYTEALSRFYGGEMVCAGLLYSPALGACYPGNPEMAYKNAYNLALFDIGYARDISALSAAMTAAAMSSPRSKESVLSVFTEIDPKGYFESRLVGRTAFRILSQAQRIAIESTGDSVLSTENKLTPEAPTKAEMQRAFQLLDNHIQDMPFHAGEILLQVLTAMLVCDFDYELTIQFLVNYGRDNDTTAAIAGAVLGAFWGMDRLPPEMVTQVRHTNKNTLDIDLDAMATGLFDKLANNSSLGK